MLVSYAWAVGQGLVEAIFPYISSTGAYPPVSCFFSLMLNLEALLLGTLVYMRHRQVVEYHRLCSEAEEDSQKVAHHSRVAAIIGILAAVGLSFVGNFQSVNIPLWHSLGAGAAFGVGSVYMGYQAWLSYQSPPGLTAPWVCHLRVACTVTSVTMLVSMITCLAVNEVTCAADEACSGDHSTMTSRAPVEGLPAPLAETSPTSGHSCWQVASAACEWMVAIGLDVYIATFIPEFSKIRLQEVVFALDPPIKASESS